MKITRRDFAKSLAAASAVLALPRAARPAATRRRLRLGLVGCGARGSLLAETLLRSNPDIELVAAGDVFPEPGPALVRRLRDAGIAGATTEPGSIFSGFDAAARVLALDLDAVILATPPVFRPAEIAAAVAAGRHIFAEAPLAVDAPGVRQVLAAADEARTKGLSFMSGTWTRRSAVAPAVERIRAARGRVISARADARHDRPAPAARREGESDVAWQIRNWRFISWLSGDLITEAHVEIFGLLDLAFGAAPEKALGTGGRQVLSGPEHGNVYDHFGVELRYPGGATAFTICRSTPGENHIGFSAATQDDRIEHEEAPPAPGAPDGVGPAMTTFLESIRRGRPDDSGAAMARATLTAILAREAVHTGRVVSMDAVAASKTSLLPPDLAFGPLPLAPVPMPGHG